MGGRHTSGSLRHCRGTTYTGIQEIQKQIQSTQELKRIKPTGGEASYLGFAAPTSTAEKGPGGHAKDVRPTAKSCYEPKRQTTSAAS